MGTWGGALNSKGTDKSAQGLEYVGGLGFILPKAARGQRTILGQGNINTLTQEGLGRGLCSVAKGESLSPRR